MSNRSVVGYITEIIGESKHTNKEQKQDFKIFKFILNNNEGCLLQCNIYNNLIQKFIFSGSIIQVNQVLISLNYIIS